MTRESMAGFYIDTDYIVYHTDVYTSIIRSIVLVSVFIISDGPIVEWLMNVSRLWVRKELHGVTAVSR